MNIPIARSDIHIHLSEEHISILFGDSHKLHNIKDLTIPGQFVCSERVIVTGPEGSIEDVVVVGPARRETQVEISITNGLSLGITPPVRMSGNLENTPGCILIGPLGSVSLKKGVIASKRHIHMHTNQAREWNLSDGQSVCVKVPGSRALIFDEVIMRVGEDQAQEMHVDFDEGHAAGITDFQSVEIIP
ncbi:MAG: phosphate propanoyltransferase [Spirochaetales bacterium]|nr:phosphate propanoyltransferase [Spirochaetales bacterium]